MNTAYLDLIAAAGAGAISHIGLVDGTGVEIAGGTYARQAVSWTTPASGDVSPTVDLTFDIPAGVTVGGWQGYSALTAGTAYGVVGLTNETFADAGTYTLLAAQTGINHNAV